MSSHTLDRLGVTPFRSIWPLNSRWFQTITPNMLPDIDDSPDQWHHFKLPDGDTIVVAENRPEIEPKRIFVTVHGLTGDYRSNYNVRLCKKLKPLGVVLFRVNLRGAGPGFGHARKTYNAGQSQDLRDVLRAIGKLYPKLPATVMGISMGANIVLKMMGEARLPRFVDSFVAVSPPFDLASTSKKLQQRSPKVDRYFSKRLMKETSKLHRKFPDLGPLDFPESCTVFDFDELYTAPRHGFKSAQDYYDRSSSLHFIPAIKAKGLVLLAKDDPVVNYGDLPKFDKRRVDFVCTPRGGHVGFFNPLSKNGPFWMDHLISSWMKHRLKV
ncbi:YheT family hydrolase [Pseudobacteriovorax antillogorgiicola]|uniref:Serine aminopeptidase S33 domain-containing protein n=1 Tax=Pseudobacteriovorax antillogorgiicola TaxID=1513793 RepID=A0A1Y6BZ20_9BACT|nr:alpha/beta fold hydrolase [Pseudobacteriovorax antillogorgiicola]TCS52973.1 hypothetical protein EDD56_10824 [Pseudobacteriovorax antillogorgiicola]SMF27424.1 hypothetical protein SAMN06296036_108223 [Pseudobacteriovorax antillogorgiicola]